MRGEVGIGFKREVDIAEDLVVVGPGWIAKVNGRIRSRGVEFGKEESTEVNSTGAGDGLERRHLEVQSLHERLFYSLSRKCREIYLHVSL